MINEFINTTAKDYNMPYLIVERIHRMWFDKGLFYEKLEELLNERRNE